MKIGVIGCTHIPQAMSALPERIKVVFKSVDIILHVGDVTNIATLKALEDNFTLTFAVAGEQDSPELKKYIEPKRVLEFAERRIGMIHGDCMPASAGSALGAPDEQAVQPQARLHAYLLSQFANVDAIVFGHTHRPYAALKNGVFLFNPGAAAPLARNRATVGILDVEPRSIAGRYVYL